MLENSLGERNKQGFELAFTLLINSTFPRNLIPDLHMFGVYRVTWHRVRVTWKEYVI